MKKSVDFSILSPIYDFLGFIVFGGALHKSQIHFLNELTDVKNVLIIGGGTGKFLVDFLKSQNPDSVTYVDISPGMIAKAKSKVKKSQNQESIKFICGGLETIEAQKFDLVCTHYFLDCFEEEELVKVMERLKVSLNENGIWHFTDFYLNKDSSKIRKAFVGFLYWFFRLTCGLKVKKLANFKQAFANLGMEFKTEKTFKRGLLRTALYSSKSF